MSDDADRLKDVEAAIEKLFALLYLMNGRLAQIEKNSADKPSVDDGVTTPKGAAGMTGFSVSQILKLCAENRLDAKKVGGRWTVKVASLGEVTRRRRRAGQF